MNRQTATAIVVVTATSPTTPRDDGNATATHATLRAEQT
jgi:hypothetical protein